MRKLLFFFAMVPVTILFMADTVKAQEYKLRQSNSMMGMKSESTVYVKGMRKRTETGPMMAGMPANPTTIEQCDLKRTIKLNDKKKLYFIEPFSKEEEEIIDDDVKPATQKKTTTPVEKTGNQKGGTITMWYNITDTGERKKIHGFTARHLWTYQKMKPSADACNMKDSMIIKTDGWYIDFPQFNCPRYYRPQKPATPSAKPEPECKDKIVNHRSGKGKLGFPLTETRTMILGGASSTSVETSLETLELTTGKLDSMLFEIPPGYTETKNESDLQDKFDPQAMMKEYEKNNVKEQNEKISVDDGQKKTGVIRIGVYEPKGDGQVQASLQQQNLVNDLRSDKVESIPVANEQEAREKNCDYVLNTDFTKIKQASKVGGIIKALKNTDPNAAVSFNISATLTLVTLADGSTKTQQKVDGKYDGKVVDDAAKKALDEGSNQVLKALK